MPTRVLIVDDALYMRSMIRDILMTTGRFEIVGEASNGREAVERFLELKPELVTMDIVMPALKGMAASMGFREIATVSHGVEDLFDEIRKDLSRAARPGVADLVMQALDVVSTLVNDASAGKTSFPDQTTLVAQVAKVASAMRKE